MRWAVLAAGVAAISIAGASGAGWAQASKITAAAPAPRAEFAALTDARAPAAQLQRTSPLSAGPERSYEAPADALIEADVDYLVREGRRVLAEGEHTPIYVLAVFADGLAAGDLASARAALEAAPGGIDGPLADMLEPFLFAAEGRADRGVERVDSGADVVPAPLPEVARALVFEAAGRLEEAAAVYALMAERLDLTPPGDAEPTSMAEFERSLAAGRTTHAIYRAALVHHRLGRTEDARRYYGIVREFSPRALDVQINLERLDAGQQPYEAPLDVKSAAGRWMLFLSEYLTQAENIQLILSAQPPEPGLISESGSALLQLGVLLATDSDDWRMQAAAQLIDANGLDGAMRVLSLVEEDAVFGADAELMRASVLLRRREFAPAIAAADRVVAHAGDRWSLLASAADVYRRANRYEQSIAALDRALAMVDTDKDRADVLGWRAYSHRFAGQITRAVTDMRAAYEIDQTLDTRLLYISILMDDPAAWNDAIAMARGVFAEQPDSVMRLNALGYALIQQPQGLEEGYRLLWRGFNFGQSDYAVTDSLGWAYYLYGRFDEALALIERANEMSARDPNFEVLDHLGDVYWRLNRRDDARAAWRQALEAEPDATRRASIERKLSRGLTTAAPRRRELPQVNLPSAPAQREEL